MSDEYKWTDNSRKMFDEVLLVTPRLFRPISRKALIRGFQEKQLTQVTEEEFIAVCKEKLPEKYLKPTLAKCEELRTRKEV